MGKNTGKVREFCQSGEVGTLVLHVSVILFTWWGVCPIACWDTPPQCMKIRATSGRYASYWNAILFNSAIVANSCTFNNLEVVSETECSWDQLPVDTYYVFFLRLKVQYPNQIIPLYMYVCCIVLHAITAMCVTKPP